MENVNNWLELANLLWALVATLVAWWSSVRAGRAGQAVRDWRKATDAVVAAVEKASVLFPDDARIKAIKRDANIMATGLGVEEDNLSRSVEEIADTVARIAKSEGPLANTIIRRDIESREARRPVTR